MATVADLMSVAVFAIMIPLVGILGISFTPQTSVEFEDVTNEKLSGVMVQSMMSTMFKRHNQDGFDNYKTMSYKLCSKTGQTSFTSQTSFSTRLNTDLGSNQPSGISNIVDYLKIDFTDIPSQCSSVSDYTEQEFYGLENPKKITRTYRKQIPVIGGDTVDMRVRYEAE
jgi:hypothetical protein